MSMGHDWLYKKIIAGLDETPKHQRFEECAVDFLQFKGYNAVWIHGGADGGKDAVVADGKCEPYPVFVTTGDVRANLRKNLPSYTKDGAKRSRYIVVASKSISNVEREKIKSLAVEHGLTECEHIFDRYAIASWLRHENPYWRKTLLDIFDVASALSAVPMSRRRYPKHTLLEREKELQWLIDANDNRLLIGEPGAGKTSLLENFVGSREGGALFVVQRDKDRLTDSVLERKPKTLILDDGFNDQDFLVEMRHFQTDMGNRFNYIVTCWPQKQQEAEDALGFGPNNTICLQRLPRQTIEEINQKTGTEKNYLLMRDIEQQSDGLPGVATWLARIASESGSLEKILSAEALFQYLQDSFEVFEDIETLAMLACFAVGGEAGMLPENVIAASSLNRLNLTAAFKKLDGTGIITTVPRNPSHLKVRIPSFRQILLRKAFFATMPPLSVSDLHALVSVSPDPLLTAKELVKSKDKGTPVPLALIKDVLELVDDSSISPMKSSWLHDDEARQAIPKLMSDAIGDNRRLNATPSHPIRLLKEWIVSEYRSASEALRRRAIILECGKDWLTTGNDLTIGYRVLLLAMIPSIEAFESNPSDNNEIQWISGYLPDDALKHIGNFWNEIVELLEQIEPQDWTEILDVISEWTYPLESPTEPIRNTMTTQAKKMALDVATVASGRVGILQRLKATMHLSYPDLEIITDEFVNILYPINEFKDDHEVQEALMRENIIKLANAWIGREAGEIASILDPIERDMHNSRGIYYRYSRLLCYKLAELAHEPLKWFRAFMKTTLPADTIKPFLQTAILRGLNGWEIALADCFETERLRASAIEVSLTLEQVTPEFKLRALKEAPQFVEQVENMVLLDGLSQPVVFDLLRHTDKKLAGKVAVAIWRRRPRGEIAKQIKNQWETAIIKHAEDDYWLAIIFEAESELGKRWLLHKFEDENFKPYMFERSISSVVAQFNLAEREAFLGGIPDRYGWDDTISLLVGDDQRLFRALLESSIDAYDKLGPLSRPSIDATWVRFAKLVFEYGHTVEEIVSHAFERSISWSGKYSDVIKSQYEQFDAYRNDGDGIVRQIMEYGYTYYLNQYNTEKKREDDEEIYGRER